MDDAKSEICLNCGADLSGRFCAACGQENIDPQMSFKAMLGEVSSSIFAMDARIFRSLKLLFFSPGVMTRDYLAGRRQRYVPPFKLYLFTTFIAFLCLSLVDARILKVQLKQPATTAQKERDAEVGREGVGTSEGERAQSGNADASDNPKAPATETAEIEEDQNQNFFQKRLREGMLKAYEDLERANRRLIQLLPKAMFVLLPLFALLLRLLYWRSDLLYPQ